MRFKFVIMEQITLSHFFSGAARFRDVVCVVTRHTCLYSY
jgi:hypothetical protein